MFRSSEITSSRPLLQITTSWDDGHPLDFRVAEMLAKYGLPGTFYVPLHNCRPTLSAAQIRELATSFEIGAHTVNHVRLTTVIDEEARREIEESKQQLEDILGKPCSVFCFPGGRYKRAHLRMVSTVGFCGVRSTELLSLRRPENRLGVRVIPTTIQAFPHVPIAYVRNALKQLRPGALRNLLAGRVASWPELGGYLLETASHLGGVFHLWGHSWEIEEMGQWQALNQVMAATSRYRHVCEMVSNTELCHDAGTHAPTA